MSIETIKRTVQIASNISSGCDHCSEDVGDAVSDGINHYIEAHGYWLLHVGTETYQSNSGDLWHNTVAILGHDDPPAVKSVTVQIGGGDPGDIEPDTAGTLKGGQM